MRPGRVNVGLTLAGVAGLAVGVRLLAGPLVAVTVPPRAERTPDVHSPHPRVPSDSLAATIVAHDPFRIAHRASAAVYDPVRLAQPPTPPTPKPILSLVGVAWDNGNDPTALVEGLPGVDGPRPLRRGDSVAGLRVKAINADRVVIIGLDTTWTLRVREPWR